MATSHGIAKDYDLSSIQNYLARVPEPHRADVDEFVAFKRSQGVKNGTLRSYALWLQKWCDSVLIVQGHGQGEPIWASLGLPIASIQSLGQQGIDNEGHQPRDAPDNEEN